MSVDDYELGVVQKSPNLDFVLKCRQEDHQEENFSLLRLQHFKKSKNDFNSECHPNWNRKFFLSGFLRLWISINRYSLLESTFDRVVFSMNEHCCPKQSEFKINQHTKHTVYFSQVFSVRGRTARRGRSDAALRFFEVAIFSSPVLFSGAEPLEVSSFQFCKSEVRNLLDRLI